jgi:hypothetical protein
VPPSARAEQLGLPAGREVAYVAAFRAISHALVQGDLGKAREQLPPSPPLFPTRRLSIWSPATSTRG